MSDKMTWLITVRFPEFKDGDHTFGPHGMKILFDTPVIPYPEWPEQDERWFDWSEEREVAKLFRADWEKKRKQAFSGEILWLERSDIFVWQ